MNSGLMGHLARMQTLPLPTLRVRYLIPIFRNFRPTWRGTTKKEIPKKVCSIHSPQNFLWNGNYKVPMVPFTFLLLDKNSTVFHFYKVQMNWRSTNWHFTTFSYHNFHLPIDWKNKYTTKPCSHCFRWRWGRVGMSVGLAAFVRSLL